MDFEWSAEQRALRERVLGAARDLSPAIALRGHDRPFEREEIQRAGGLGLLGLCVPVEDGGGGLRLLDTACALEALALGSGDLGLTFAVAAHLFACCVPIAAHGSRELGRRVLPLLCSGQWLGANAITEEGAGSDVFALSAEARRDGDSYVLRGDKSFVTNGPLADLFIVYAKTNPAHGFLGISAFAVERETPGLVVGPHLQKMGLLSTPTSSVHLEDCVVPASHRLGEEGQGSLVFNHSMQWERAGLFAAFTGDMQRRLAQTIEHARTRRQFGQRIGKKQAIAHRIADMKVRLEYARLLWQRACWMIDRGTASPLDVAMAKLAVSEAAVASGLDCIQIFGGRGYLQEHGVERALRDATAATLASGTGEMMRDIIARELGL